MNIWTDSRTRVVLVVVLVLAVTLLLSGTVYAQGYGRVISQPEDEDYSGVRPYLLVNLGYGNPTDDAYDLAFDNPYFRFGGGFGMIFHNFGAEVLLRRGIQEETHLVAAEYDQQYLRSFYLSTTEIQFRLYGRPHVGKVVFPTGFGVGLVTMTVDRGYPGVFDRFSGSGWYIGPFVGAEYRVNDLVALGAEVEYAINESSFSGSSAWETQHSALINEQGGFFPATEDGFWDTVGGYNEEFSNSGFVFSIRAILYIPTYTGN